MIQMFLNRLYDITDNRLVRFISFVFALTLAGCLFVQPSLFAAKTSPLQVWHSIVIIWSVCAGMIHGSGFYLQASFWRFFFSPLLAIGVMVVGIVYFYVMKFY